MWAAVGIEGRLWPAQTCCGQRLDISWIQATKASGYLRRLIAIVPHTSGDKNLASGPDSEDPPARALAAASRVPKVRPQTSTLLRPQKQKLETFPQNLQTLHPKLVGAATPRHPAPFAGALVEAPSNWVQSLSAQRLDLSL